MSVQLIVFPQSYDGQFNSIASTPNEFVVDGINFNTIDTSDSYDSSSSGNVILDVLTNQPPSPINTWFRFRTTSSGTPTLPTELSGKLTLVSVPTLTLSGVYQKLSNLVVGTTYEMTIDLSTTGTGSVLTSAYNGTTLISQPLHSANQSQITFSWTAASTEDTIAISYYNGAVDNIMISNISVSPQGITPTTIYTDLQDGQVICDLYEDEDIPLSLSVDDFKNVAEKVQSYSKAFNLPATKRNNQIFDNIFEITRTDTGLNFNPYKRTKAILKQDGFLLFEGYLRMIDISDKSGEISYNVNLYSEVVALADVLGDKTFSDLDFSELTHDYNYTEIRNSWQGILGLSNPLPVGSFAGTAGTSVTDVLRYPFIDWTHQYTFNASSGFPVLPNLESAFRPFINIRYIIDRIFQATDFTYESTFFNTADFDKLYMDFNWGSAQAPNNNLGQGTGENDNTAGVVAGGTSTRLQFDVEDFSTATELGYSNATSKFTASFDNQMFEVSSKFVIGYSGWSSGQLGVLGWEKFDSLGVSTGYFAGYVPIQPFGSATFGNQQATSNFTIYLDTGESIRPSFYNIQGGGTSMYQQPSSALAAFTQNSTTVVTGTSTTTSETLLQNLRGELGQWDFLKGLLTMFNLVTLPDEDNPNNIKIEPYEDIFINNADSKELDWTDKIDVSEMKLTPLTELNKKTIFKFVEDDDDYAFNKYKNDVGGHLYGSKKFDASEFSILAGEDEVVAEPFAATVIKPLMEQFSDFITPALYSMNEDGTSEGFDNSPRIMYKNGVKTLTSCTYNVPAQNGVAGDAFEDEFLQFSHLSSVATISGTRDFHFGECQLIQAVGSPVNDNLFNLYWLPYYSELYNPDTRTMTIKVNLSPSDINTFKFYDTVIIKNRTYRVNKIDYKPNDLATVEFILLQ